MKRATAVMGSCFGDEGKGLMTDFFCRQASEKPVVVRFNGGAQAGHTVVTPEGQRHVFHHYGAGTFAKADTYLSAYFLINPVAWHEEFQELYYKLEFTRPKLLVHHWAPVTTVYDMFLNQKIEEARAERHGSCGMGVHETILRQNEGWRLSAIHLFDDFVLEQKVRDIRMYALRRLIDLGLDNDKNKEFIMSIDVLQKFLYQCQFFKADAKLCSDSILAQYKDVIFEGAQGLLLDQDNKRFFPHVTHSKTGLHNVIKICENAQIERIDACYVARSYLTRHGAGKLPREDPNMKFEDKTNVYNDWQHSLRFAPQDWYLLDASICFDIRSRSSVEIYPSLAITHRDQCEITSVTPYIKSLHKYSSYGPTYKDVRAPISRDWY